MRALFASPRAAERIARARAWLALASAEGGAELLVVAAGPDAGRDLLREAARERGASFGWHRATLARLAASLAAPARASAGVPARRSSASVRASARGSPGPSPTRA